MTPEERKQLIETLLKKVGLPMDNAANIKGEDKAAITEEILLLTASDLERRVTKAIETNSKKLKDEFQAQVDEIKKSNASIGADNGNGGAAAGDGKNSDANAGSGSKDTGTPDIAKLIADALKPVTDKLTAIETEKQQQERTAKISEELKTAGLKSNMAKYVVVGEDGDIKKAVESLKTDLTAAKQAEIDVWLAGQEPPGKGDGDGGSMAGAIKGFAETRSKPTTGLATKQLAETAQR